MKSWLELVSRLCQLRTSYNSPEPRIVEIVEVRAIGVFYLQPILFTLTVLLRSLCNLPSKVIEDVMFTILQIECSDECTRWKSLFPHLFYQLLWASEPSSIIFQSIEISIHNISIHDVILDTTTAQIIINQLDLSLTLLNIIDWTKNIEKLDR